MRPQNHWKQSYLGKSLNPTAHPKKNLKRMEGAQTVTLCHKFLLNQRCFWTVFSELYFLWLPA